MSDNNDARHDASPCIYIPDDYVGFPKDSLCIPAHFNDCINCVLIPGGIVKDRIERMACDITSDIGNESFTALCVLKGGYQFFADLLHMIRQIYRVSSLYMNPHTSSKNDVQNGSNNKLTPFHIRAEFIRVKSYQDDKSTGDVRITGIEDLASLTGQNVLVVEDIIDSGQTMVKLLDALKSYKPKTLRVTSLFWKRNPNSTGYVPHYVGFNIPDKFIIGYNLDYNDFFRELNHVCVIADDAKSRFAVRDNDGQKEKKEEQSDDRKRETKTEREI